MYYKTIKPGKIILLLIIFYLLGFTHFLGGPFGLAKFIFFCILIGGVLFFFFLWKIVRFADKISKSVDEQGTNKNETIKVDATIIE